MWRLIPLIVFVILAYFMWHGLNINPKLLPSTLIDHTVPTFNLPVVNVSESPRAHSSHAQSTHAPKNQAQSAGDSLTQQDFLGHVSLLNVWTSSCSTCREEHPVLLDIARSKQVLVYGLAYKDNQDDVRRWLKSAGNPYQKVGFDADGKVGMELGVYGTPETYLIDSKGIIRYRHIGAMTQEVWQTKILPLIAQQQH